jgi:hypothetical protein
MIGEFLLTTQIIAQGFSTIYLPVQSMQSSRQGCANFSVTNSTNSILYNVKANYVNNQAGETSQLVATSFRPRETTTFSICQGYFRNVQADQYY